MAHKALWQVLDEKRDQYADYHALGFDTESRARYIGDHPELLKVRLLDAHDCLIREYRERPYTLDLPNRRIIIGSRYVLQWRIREFPDQPEAYHNQQTNTGSCFFEDRED